MASGWVFMQIFEVISNASLYQIFLEGGLLVGVVWLIFHKSSNENAAAIRQLTEKEKQKLIEEWIPEPLVKDVLSDHVALKPRIVTGKAGLYINLDGHNCINMATHNYLNFIGDTKIEEKAIQTVKKYGVGSCGPRGFYGTVDVHLELEEKLAKFMDMEDAVVYSYNFSTIASAIPAYAKRGDIIFVDECVNFAIQKGLDASRSKICFFKHNDMASLEKQLMLQDNVDKKNIRKAMVKRRFLVVEGIYMNTGEICKLPELIELRKKYKLRLFIDENVSFGTLGKHGRGVTEHFNVDKAEVDLIVGSMEGAMGSIGGFCVGSHFIVDHQRLSGQGYCFSASLPPLLTSAAISALELMEKNTGMFEKLKAMCNLTHEVMTRVKFLRVCGNSDSPVKHLTLANNLETEEVEHEALTGIVDHCEEHGVALVVSTYLPCERFKKVPSIRLTVNVAITVEEVETVAKTLQEACMKILVSHIEDGNNT